VASERSSDVGIVQPADIHHQDHVPSGTAQQPQTGVDPGNHDGTSPTHDDSGDVQDGSDDSSNDTNNDDSSNDTNNDDGDTGRDTGGGDDGTSSPGTSDGENENTGGAQAGSGDGSDAQQDTSPSNPSDG
jgi:penicillin-binding protein 1A